MTFFVSKRALLPVLLAACTGALLNCNGGGPQYDFTTQGDDAVTTSIVGTWEGTASDGRTFLVDLCEDESDRLTALSCETLHRIKGNDQGTTETTNEPGGCGGCDYDYSLYVAGTIEGTDLASSTFLGQFGISGGDKSGPGFPYRTQASSDGSESRAGLFWSGTMPSADTFTLDTLTYPASAISTVDAGTGAVDAGGSDVDGGESDAAAPAPAPSASGSASSGSPQAMQTLTNVVFHRIGAASCPARTN